MTTEASSELIILTALQLRGGDRFPVDVEDVAIQADALGPGRFRWRKYSEHINIQTIGKLLRDAKKRGLSRGSSASGWMLTDEGLAALAGLSPLGVQPVRIARSRGDRAWLLNERQRLLTEPAFTKISNGDVALSKRDAERFFRLDEYVQGDARLARIDRLMRAFGRDPVLGETIQRVRRALAE